MASVKEGKYTQGLKKAVPTKRSKCHLFKKQHHKRKVTAEMIDWLLAPKQFDQHVGLTLAERAIMLHRNFSEVHVTGNTIGRYFKEHQVKKKKVVMKKRVKWGKRGSVQEQIENCREQLQVAIDEEKLIVWVDETMLTTKTYQLKDWAPLRSNRELDEKHMNIKSTAFVGAIARDEGLIYYELFDRSVNYVKWEGFVRALAKKLRKKSWVLYLDNLRVHTCRAAMALYKELGIETCFAPAYSPDYNSIEFWFSWLKKEVKKIRLQDMSNGLTRGYRKIIPEVAARADKEQINKFVQHVMNLFLIEVK